MKLTDLVADKTKLKTFGKYISPDEAFERIEKGDNDPLLVKVVVTDPVSAYYYASDVVRGRWHKGEPAIATDPHYAFYYASDVVRGRWHKGEPAIATDPHYAFYYARDIIKGRWKMEDGRWKMEEAI